MALTSSNSRNRNADSSAAWCNKDSTAKLLLLEGGNQHHCAALLLWNSPVSHCAEARDPPLQMENENSRPRTIRRIQLPSGDKIRHVLQVQHCWLHISAGNSLADAVDVAEWDQHPVPFCSSSFPVRDNDGSSVGCSTLWLVQGAEKEANEVPWDVKGMVVVQFSTGCCVHSS